MKKIWSLFLLIILLGFCIGDIAYCACTGDPNDESEIAYETSVILEGMVTVINLYGPDMFFPPLCEDPENRPCWSHDGISHHQSLRQSFSGSTKPLDVLMTMFGGPSLIPDRCDSFGDIRFRCRYEKNGNYYCFAYRCETEGEGEPCKQRWRLRIKGSDSSIKCFDVGVDDSACAPF